MRKSIFFNFLLFQIILFGLTSGNSAKAQDSMGQKNTIQLDLKKALELAVQNYPSIKARDLDKQAAEKEVQSVKSEFIPALIWQQQLTYASANGAVGTFWPNEGFAIPTSGANRNHNIYTGAFGNYSTIAVNWPLFSFGKIRSHVTLAKAEAQEASSEYENEVFQHKIKVIDAYLSLLVTQKLVSVQQQNLARAQILKNTITAAAASGLRPGVDSSYANAELSRTKIYLLESMSKEKASRIKLGELIGSEKDSIVVDTMSFYLQTPVIEGGNPDVTNNPLLRVYQNRVDVGIKRANATMKSYFPTIKFMAAGIGRGSGISNTNDLNYNQNPGAGFKYKTYNYLLGFYFLWNLLDYPRIRYAYQSDKLVAQSRQFEYDEAKLKLNRELENAKIQIELAQQQVKEAPVQLRAATEAYGQVQARYKSGLSTLPEVAQNFYVLNRAEVDMAIAYNNMWRALMIQSAATGDLNLFMNQVK